MYPNNNSTANYNIINYTHGFEFENTFDFHSKFNLLQNYWKASFLFVIIYISFIYFGKHWMKFHKGFQLRRSLAVWNFALAIYSLIGVYRFLPEMIYVWKNDGFQQTVCTLYFRGSRPSLGVWLLYFALSKVVEFGDTVFIILRKQKLVFLHWYHHSTVLIYTWYSTQQLIATGPWFATMNLLVHSAMYSYYGLKALKFKIPRAVAMVITTSQLLQMVGGLFANWWAYQALIRGDKCEINLWNIKMSLLMYSSYWVLFANLFYNSYLRKQLRKKNE